MKDNLTQFLTQLTTDMNLRESFLEDSKGVMQSYGLASEYIDLVINHNYDAISAILGREFDVSMNTVIGAYRNSENILRDRFAKFLCELTCNSQLIEDYNRDPIYTMKHFGLTQKCIDLVVNKDYESIQNMLGADYTIAHNDVIKAFKLKGEQKKAS